MNQPPLPHRRTVLSTAWLLPALLVTLAACSGARSAPAAAVSLVGTEWRLHSIHGQPVMDRSAASLQFPEAGRVAGNGSCNRFVGAVAIDKDQIVFRQMAATKMACMGGAGEQEARYMEALRQAQRYQVRDGQLLITVQGMDSPLRFDQTK
jgi:heat shock protein HslJ